MRAIAIAAGILLLAVSAGCDASGSKATGRFLIVASIHPSLGHLLAPRVEIVDGAGHVIRTIIASSGGKGSGVHVGTASLSPNRKWVAWQDTRGLHVERVQGSRPRLLVRGGGATVWSPDSRKLLVAVEGGARLAVVSVSTGAERRILVPHRHVTYLPLAWSGSAHSILFDTDNEGGANGIGCCSDRLVLATPSGASPRTIYTAADPIHDAAQPSWSPDGKWIVFTTDGRAYPSDPRGAIVDLATGKTTSLHDFNGYTAKPVWAPDSTRFAAGGYNGPVELFSSRGRRVGSIDERSAVPIAWTRAGMFLLPGGSQWASTLLLIPNGSTRAKTVLTLPSGQVLLSAQPL